MSLAARLAPHLATLIHPGDADTPAFPLTLPVFQTATLPDGMAQEMADQAGMPTPDIALHWMEAVLHLIGTVGDVELIPRGQRQSELAELHALRGGQEPKRNQIKPISCRVCREELFRVTIQDFDTDHPCTTPEVITAMQGKTADCGTRHRIVA